MDITLKDAAAVSACIMPPSLCFGSSAPTNTVHSPASASDNDDDGEEWRVSTLFLLRRVGGASGELKRACDKLLVHNTRRATG